MQPRTATYGRRGEGLFPAVGHSELIIILLMKCTDKGTHYTLHLLVYGS